MKKLNETQKKWALTACLSTVLSFNLVMGLAGSSYSTLSFASSKDDGDVYVSDVTQHVDSESADDADVEKKLHRILTDKGTVDVMYIRAEGGKTKAIIPKKVEGTYCWEDCGKTYLLPKNFNSNKADLKLALYTAMAQEKFKQAKEEKELADNTATEEDDDLESKIVEEVKKVKKHTEEEDEENPDMLALHKKCDSKEDDSRMTCFANGLTRLLTDKKKEYAKEDVMAIYKKEIEPQLLESLTDMRDGDRRDEGHTIMEDMLGTVSKKYNYVRERLVKLSALVVIKAEKDAQKSFQRAESLKTTNPMQAMRLQADGFNRRSMAEYMAMNMDSTLQSGLESAQFSNLISEGRVMDMYSTNYLDVVNPIIQGMRQNPYTYLIQSQPMFDGSSNLLVDGNGNVLSSSSGLGAIGQLRQMGNGIAVMSNGLTSANVITGNTPRIMTVNGAGPGTATIQVIPASALPAGLNQSGVSQQQILPAPAMSGQPMAVPGTNVISIRGN